METCSWRQILQSIQIKFIYLFRERGRKIETDPEKELFYLLTAQMPALARAGLELKPRTQNSGQLSQG